MTLRIPFSLIDPPEEFLKLRLQSDCSTVDQFGKSLRDACCQSGLDLTEISILFSDFAAIIAAKLQIFLALFDGNLDLAAFCRKNLALVVPFPENLDLTALFC